MYYNEANKKTFLLIILFLITITTTKCNHLQVYNVEKPIKNPTPHLKSRIDFLKQMPKNAIVVEIGVQKGNFADLILKYTNPKQLYLIDCWEHQSTEIYPGDSANISNREQEKLYQNVLRRFKNDKRVTIIREYSPEVSNLFDDEFFDWIYIDANHTYNAVKSDLNAWIKKLKQGGLLSGHDYCSVYSVFGVIRAVNEFLLNQNLEIKYLTAEKFPSYAIEKK
ncbi:class I SAM-dependent methyltransferase [Candidatus Dependentiae bacterium]